MPPAVVTTLNAAVAKATDTAEWKKFCGETYTCIERKTPEDSRRFAQKNYDDVTRFMKEYGMVK